MKIRSCKCHKTPYTVCPDCGAEYCKQTWPVCPRTSWHPSHGTSAEDMGHRYNVMAQAREQREANLKAMGR